MIIVLEPEERNKKMPKNQKPDSRSLKAAEAASASSEPKQKKRTVRQKAASDKPDSGEKKSGGIKKSGQKPMAVPASASASDQAPVRTAEHQVPDPASYHEEVSRLAYELWEKRGCPHGSHDEDWLQAEEEIKRKYFS
jgi:hypothetical protein